MPEFWRLVLNKLAPGIWHFHREFAVLRKFFSFNSFHLATHLFPFGSVIAFSFVNQERKELDMTSKVLPLFAISITLMAFTAVSPAQPRHELTAAAYVPFEFVIGNRVFPAGTYVFEIATGSPKITDEAGVLVVRNRERGLYAAIATGVAADSDVHTKPGLAFRRDGERMYLANVWCRRSEAGLAVHLPQGVAEIVEREPLTLDATMTGGI